MFTRNDYLAPKIVQTIGLLALLIQLGFYFITNRYEPVFLGAFGSMIPIGQFLGARQALERPPEPPKPTDAATVEREA
jgi:hypothetical protein